jgi:hypothetical protein
MKRPITLVLLLPILFICFAFFGDNGGYAFVLIAVTGFLIEIKIKKGSISKHSIKEFFNTPMNPRGETEQEMLMRSNLEYSFSAIGLLACLGWLLVAPYFGIKLYSEYKDWEFFIDIETILFMTYLLVLGVLYRVFFVKHIEN